MQMETSSNSRALEGVAVLVVEDNAPLRTAVRRFLERAGCTVVDVGSPSEAFGAARAYAGRLDLALVDLILPEMSGPECADTLVEERPGLAVAYMSGYAGSVSGGLPGDDAPMLLQKPFARDELVNAVRSVLGMQELPQFPPAYC